MMESILNMLKSTNLILSPDVGVVVNFWMVFPLVLQKVCLMTSREATSKYS